MKLSEARFVDSCNLHSSALCWQCEHSGQWQAGHRVSVSTRHSRHTGLAGAGEWFGPQQAAESLGRRGGQ